MSTAAHVPFLEYDDASHVYYLDGEEVVSITQVLKEVGCIDDQYFTEEHARRGTLVHSMSEIWDSGPQGLSMAESLADLSPTEEEMEISAKYLAQYLRLREDIHFTIEPEGIERKVFDPLHRYAGRLDRHIKLRAPCVDVALAELKTNASGTIYPWWGLQLAAQGHALEPNALFRRFAFVLTPERYIVHEFPVENFVEDRDTFLSMVRAVRWLRANR